MRTFFKVHLKTPLEIGYRTCRRTFDSYRRPDQCALRLLVDNHSLDRDGGRYFKQT